MVMGRQVSEPGRVLTWAPWRPEQQRESSLDHTWSRGGDGESGSGCDTVRVLDDYRCLRERAFES
jgi:hypothetical protein